jgi:hypothetical protein
LGEIDTPPVDATYQQQRQTQRDLLDSTSGAVNDTSTPTRPLPIIGISTLERVFQPIRRLVNYDDSSANVRRIYTNVYIYIYIYIYIPMYFGYKEKDGTR